METDATMQKQKKKGWKKKMSLIEQQKQIEICSTLSHVVLM